MNVIIYGKKDCPFCVKAKLLSEQLKNMRSDFTFTYFDYEDEGFTKETLSEKLNTNVSTLPQITLNDQLIGGYTDFEAYVRKNRLFSKN